MGDITLHHGGRLSAEDLVRLQHEGKAVSRSAHVGNQYLSNMLLATVGLPLCLYDRTVIRKDVNYHPGSLIREGRAEKLTNDDGALSPFARSYGSGPVPVRHHLETTRQLFNGLVRVESDLFLTHSERIAAVLNKVAHFEDCVNRYVLECGCMVTLRVEYGEAWSESCGHGNRVSFSSGKLGEEAMRLFRTISAKVHNRASSEAVGGAVLSLPLAIVLITLMLVWESGHDEVYELSGPDMIGYALKSGFMWDISRAWERIRQGCRNLPIPESIRLFIVPTASFRFGFLEGDAGSERAMEILSSLLETNRERKRCLRETRNPAHPLQARFDSLLREMQDIGRKWNVFYDIHEGNFFSHHDLLASGRKLVVPDWAMRLSFNELDRLTERLPAVLRNGKRARANL